MRILGKLAGIKFTLVRVREDPPPHPSCAIYDVMASCDLQVVAATKKNKSTKHRNCVSAPVKVGLCNNTSHPKTAVNSLGRDYSHQCGVYQLHFCPTFKYLVALLVPLSAMTSAVERMGARQKACANKQNKTPIQVGKRYCMTDADHSFPMSELTRKY